MGRLVLKRPEPGDEISFKCPLRGKERGIVDHVLSAQFVFIREDGSHGYCMFKTHWDLISSDNEVPERKPMKIRALAKKIKRGLKFKSGKSKPAKKAGLELGSMDLGSMVENELKPKKGESVLDFLKRTRSDNDT